MWGRGSEFCGGPWVGGGGGAQSLGCVQSPPLHLTFWLHDDVSGKVLRREERKQARANHRVAFHWGTWARWRRSRAVLVWPRCAIRPSIPFPTLTIHRILYSNSSSSPSWPNTKFCQFGRRVLCWINMIGLDETRQGASTYSRLSLLVFLIFFWKRKRILFIGFCISLINR